MYKIRREGSLSKNNSSSPWTKKLCVVKTVNMSTTQALCTLHNLHCCRQLQTVVYIRTFFITRTRHCVKNTISDHKAPPNQLQWIALLFWRATQHSNIIENEHLWVGSLKEYGHITRFWASLNLISTWSTTNRWTVKLLYSCQPNIICFCN